MRFSFVALALAVAGCAGTKSRVVVDDDDTSTGGGASAAATTTVSSGAGGADCGPDDAGPDDVLAEGGPDPAGGVFTLEQALDGLPAGPGPLRADIVTSAGSITCTFEPEVAPNAVANFVGLARGRRPWNDPATGAWVRRRFYDGLLFHRIIDDFMAQGGDPLGTGVGGPGYKIADEIGDLLHRPGTLSYANSGPNSNGSQFFITEVATDWLDGTFTILGFCEPQATIEQLTATPTGASDRPLQDTHIVRVDVTRCAP